MIRASCNSVAKVVVFPLQDVRKRPVTTPCPRHPARIWPSPYPAAGRHVCGSSVPISLSLVVGSRVS
ncbi:MAG: hypothetical protein LW860_15090, partial [Xanthomonadaceae bacterium]|nr:hypothetical protein [Xanthomonadaceae bacterium]